MDNAITVRQYQYIVRMIEQSRFNANGIPKKFFDEDIDNPHSLFFHIKKVCRDECAGIAALDKQIAFQVLTTALSKYLLKYPANASTKLRLYQHIFSWCEDLGDQFHIPNYEMCLSDIPNPIDRDLTIALIKELHSTDGVSKAELAEKYGVSEKTIQVCLHQLSGDSHYQPLRICGQTVVVPIDHKKKEHRKDTLKYYTPNTLSPIVFQLNLMQVETLLKSFQLNFAADHNIPLDLAVETWGQLTDHVKERIREIFCRRDPELAEFLDYVEEETMSDEYRFMTESQMLEWKDMRISEQLEIAYKGGMVCNVSLLSPHRTLKNQRIDYDHVIQSFYCVSNDDILGERIYFTPDDVYMISET